MPYSAGVVLYQGMAKIEKKDLEDKLW